MNKKSKIIKIVSLITLCLLIFVTLGNSSASLLTTYLTAPETDRALLKGNASADASNVEAYSEKGKELAQSGDYSQALAHFDLALKLEPQEAPLYLERGKVHLVLNNLQEAVADIEKAIKLDPGLAEAYIYRGIIHKVQGYLNRAIDDFTVVLKHWPENTSILFERGDSYAMQQKWSQVIEDMNALLMIDPENVNGLALRAQGLLRIGDFVGALGDLDRIEEHTGPNQEVGYNRGGIYFSKGD